MLVQVGLILAMFAAGSVKPAAAADVVVTKLDGASLTGELLDLSSEHVALTASGKDESLKVTELLSLRWSPGPAAADVKHPAAELSDGTVLPIDEYTTTKGEVRVTLRFLADSDSKEIVMPSKQVAAVCLQPLENELMEQWDEVRGQDFASDVLVVLRRDGKSLDYVEGVLGDVTSSKVAFKLADESLDVDRKKVAGLIYYRRDTDEQATGADPRCILHGRSGLVANARQIELASGELHVTSVGGLKFAWPLEDVFLADFSAGKVVYLSDLEPAEQQWEPLVGLPAGAKLAGDFGLPRRDRSAYGGPLTISLPGATAQGASTGVQAYDKGLAIRSRTEMVYRLPRGFQRFQAVAGIEPATSTRGDVFLSIEGDGRRLLETQVAGDQPPHEIELDIEGVKRLSIVVDYGRNLDTGDWLNLCNARILK
jgi:NPCBM/NEW2 domain